MLETIQVVLDRPKDGEPGALVYVAEHVGKGGQSPIATSPVFRPEGDPTAHRQALAELESRLQTDGWEREQDGEHGVIGARFHRLRE